MVKHQYLCLFVLTDFAVAASSCGWAPWTRWGSCRLRPGRCQPMRTRIRQCRGESACCVGDRAQVEPCGERRPDCDQCTEWSACCNGVRTRTCGEGTYTQRKESENCDAKALNEVSFNEWSACSATCGVDSVRQRLVTYPQCPGMEPITENELCQVQACIKIPTQPDTNENEDRINELQRMVEMLMNQLNNIMSTGKTSPVTTPTPQTSQPLSRCSYEHDQSANKCIGKQNGLTGRSITPCPSPYLSWSEWTTALHATTGEVIVNQMVRTRHLDLSVGDMSRCFPDIQTRDQSMPDIADACSYSLVQSVLFGSQSVACKSTFDESFRPYFESDFECADPYGDWSDWTTYDAQTEVRIRHKKETIMARKFECDTTEYDFRAIQINPPTTTIKPETQPPSVTYPPGTQFGSDSFKLCFWCRRIV